MKRSDLFYNNKPISPHLSIYRSQESSLSSILHRFSGIILFFSLVYSLLNLFFILNSFCIPIKIYCIQFVELNLLILTFLLIYCFIYHFLSGIRLILWNLEYRYINNKNLNFFGFNILIFSWLFIIIKLI